MCKKCERKECKDCSELPQPPTDTLIPLDGQNCIACKDDKTLCQKHNVNKYLKGFSYKELCKRYIEPSLVGYQGIIDPAALQYTLNPPLVVPPGQKGYNMVPDPVAYPVAPHYPPIDNPLPLQGKNVLVVGAAKNLGKAIAQMFYDNGCNVVGTSRYPECYDETFVYPLLKLDARFSEDVKCFFKKLMRKHFTNNKIDILVNLPGIQTFGTLEQSNGDDLTDVLDGNVSTYQRVTYHALPFMKFSNDTRVISFGSIAGEFPTPIPAYSVSKRALQMWNDLHMSEALQRKAMGFSQYEPTFTLIEPDFIESTIGLVESYVMADNDPFSLTTRGMRMGASANQSATTVTYPAIACPQNPPPPPFVPPFSTCPCPSVPPLCSSVPAIVAEAVHQIVLAPQPSVRYLISPAPDPLGSIQLVQAANILSCDEFLNQVYAPLSLFFFSPDTAALGQAILKDSFCQ